MKRARRKPWLYALLVIVFVGSLMMVLFAAAVRQVVLGDTRFGVLGEAVLAVAEFPSLVKQVLTESPIPVPGIGGRGNQVIDDRFPDLDGFSRSGEIQAGALEDTGYLLLSSYDTDKEQPTVRLIRIADQQLLYEWVPDMNAMKELTGSKINGHAMRLFHPLLLEDGSLIYHNSYTSLFRSTSTSITWQLEGVYHHSNELDAEGNIWVASRVEPFDYIGTLNHLDDAITQISLAGEVFSRESVTRILDENGYRGLLAAGFSTTSRDPLHLNDIQPALTDTEFWKKGDLLLSIRDLSTVALYRPSTDRIVWLRTGPWMMQHDVDFVNDHQISVFGNDVINDPGNTLAGADHLPAQRVLLDGHNNVYIYDFGTDTVTTPYSAAMESMDVRTLTEGRAKVLANGDVFIEETNYGRILRLTPETARWEYVRRVDEDHLAHLSWSRYLDEEQVQKVLPILQDGSYNQ